MLLIMKCLELVVYTIRAGFEAEFLDLYRMIRQEMSGLAGFHSAETLQALENPRTFMDLWVWDNAELAKAAHAQFDSLPHAKAFLSVVERVHYSGHFFPAL